MKISRNFDGVEKKIAKFKVLHYKNGANVHFNGFASEFVTVIVMDSRKYNWFHL